MRAGRRRLLRDGSAERVQQHASLCCGCFGRARSLLRAHAQQCARLHRHPRSRRGQLSVNAIEMIGCVTRRMPLTGVPFSKRSVMRLNHESDITKNSSSACFCSADTHTHIHTLTHSLTHARVRTHTRTHTPTRTHARTHTHIWSCPHAYAVRVIVVVLARKPRLPAPTPRASTTTRVHPHSPASPRR